jgi:hypothetical protein
VTTGFNLMDPLPQTLSVFQPYIVENMALEMVYLARSLRPSLPWRRGGVVFSGMSGRVSLLTVDYAMAMQK